MSYLSSLLKIAAIINGVAITNYYMFACETCTPFLVASLSVLYSQLIQYISMHHYYRLQYISMVVDRLTVTYDVIIKTAIDLDFLRSMENHLFSYLWLNLTWNVQLMNLLNYITLRPHDTVYIFRLSLHILWKFRLILSQECFNLQWKLLHSRVWKTKPIYSCSSVLYTETIPQLNMLFFMDFFVTDKWP